MYIVYLKYKRFNTQMRKWENKNKGEFLKCSFRQELVLQLWTSLYESFETICVLLR